MSAIKEKNISKLETTYAIEQEANQLSTARKKKVVFRRLTVFFLVATVVSFFMISTLLSQHEALAKKNEEKIKLQKELKALKKEEVILNEDIVKLNDDEYIAKLARSEYYLSNDNEIIFTLPEGDHKKD